jgi:hypothetical protein
MLLIIFVGFGVVKLYELLTHKVSDVGLLYAQFVFGLAKHSSQPGEVCTEFAKNYTEFIRSDPRIWAVVFD